MTTKIGIGFSKDLDITTAAKEAAFNSKTHLDSPSVDMAFIFSSIHYSPQKTLPTINTVLNSPRTIGCSTAGIILSSSIENRGIMVLTIYSDEINFGIGSINNIPEDESQQAGAALARDSLNDFGQHGRHAFIFFIDGYLRNNPVFLKGIQEVLGNVFPIFGAGSCDNFRFKETFQMFQNDIIIHGAVGAILGGHVSIGYGCQHGWRPLGKPRIIDKAEGNIIKTIDGEKAITLYQEYFGDETKDLHSNQLGQMATLYPLGIFIDGSHEYLLRNIVDVLSDGSIVCQGDIPENAEVHIMIGSKDVCRQAAKEAAEEAKQSLLGKEAKLIIVFESMARLKLLGRTAIEEIKHIHEVFDSNIPLVGMYGNGEISPFQTLEKFKKPYLLNESIAILAIA